jgi:hypothetical protein
MNMSLKRVNISVTTLLCAVVATTTAFALQNGAQPESAPYHPVIDPVSFSTDVNNPYFTLTPGTTYTYKGKDREGTEINKVMVTDRTRKVMGVTVREVWDRVWLNDQLIEETYDWYAQDKDGNVWYFGEDSKEIARGKVVSTKGSWEAGVKGAQPGIVMQADPRPGKPYRQEYLKGEAEDMAQVLSIHATARVPAGSFEDCLKTRDWSAIEAGTTEHKYYSRKIGAVVLETEHGGAKRVELVEVTRASTKKSENKEKKK